MKINYTERMWSYYPEVIKAILEFQSIINSEAPEIESINQGVQRVLDDAYLNTMSEDRLKQWEKILDIPALSSPLERRREAVIARIIGQGKLNTESINRIVKVFTGGTANSWIKNNTLYVEVTPPPGSKDYEFDTLKRELTRKIPAHLGFKVERNYYTWGQVYEDHGDETTHADGWQQVLDDKQMWEDVLLFVPEGFESGVEIK